jgi:uncharacterized protein (DUF2147 family)
VRTSWDNTAQPEEEDVKGIFAYASAAALLAVMTVPAIAQDATGIWLRESGASRVRVAKCGEALCGTIVWLRDADSKAKVGQRVFFDMKPDGANAWAGKAFNPEDGKEYTGKMSVSGNTLTTAGCVLGGLICQSVKWSKVE